MSVDRLQKVENFLPRVVDASVRRHHITPTLKKLHWLPIHQRIHFKIASLTVKTFNLPICLISLHPMFLLGTYDPSKSIYLQYLTFVQQMVAVCLLLLHRLFGIHDLLHFVPVLLYPRFSPA